MKKSIAARTAGLGACLFLLAQELTAFPPQAPPTSQSQTLPEKPAAQSRQPASQPSLPASPPQRPSPAQQAAASQQQPTAPAKKLKVLISADMEGVGGVSTWQVQADPSGREYAKFRHQMTQEVNMAVIGAQASGAGEVIVADSHGDGQNIDLEELNPAARLVRAFPRPLGMMQGIDNTFDAVIFIGYHASAGQPSAVLAHTMSSRRVAEIQLNGRVASEALFNAAIAGEFGVPVVFLSGDQTICEEARREIGPIETAAVKQATGFYSATMLNLRDVRQQIFEGVKRAVARRAELKPLKLEHPVKMEITFKNTIDAEIAGLLPGVERPRGNTIVFTAKDMLEASRFLEAILDMNEYHD
jgi:D-amino peptidase